MSESRIDDGSAAAIVVHQRLQIRKSPRGLRLARFNDTAGATAHRPESTGLKWPRELLSVSSQKHRTPLFWLFAQVTILQPHIIVGRVVKPLNFGVTQSP